LLIVVQITPAKKSWGGIGSPQKVVQVGTNEIETVTQFEVQGTPWMLGEFHNEIFSKIMRLISALTCPIRNLM
jgi:hypothetical protein